ncbi:MAG: hypothetical protein HC898_00815 [Phycisphaerales bacterium]|nr:hypothetical protein [Phycisphaerales bacterium]
MDHLLVSYLGWLVMMRWMIPVTFGGWWAMCIYLGLHFPAALLVFRMLVKHWRIPATLALPMAWVSFEWLRGHFPSGGFGWYALGHALAPWQVSHETPTIAQLASIFGEMGISFLVAMTSGFCIDGVRFFYSSRYKDTASWRSMNSRYFIVVSNTFILCWGLVFYFVYQQAIHRPSSSTWARAAVAVVQTNLPQFNKIQPTPERLQEEWTELLSMTRQAAEELKKTRRDAPVRFVDGNGGTTTTG